MKRLIIIWLFLLALSAAAVAQIQVTNAHIIKDNGGTKTIGYTVTTTGNVKVLRGEFYFYEGRKPNPDSSIAEVDKSLYMQKVDLTKTKKEDTLTTANIKVDFYKNSHDPELKKVIKNHLYFYGKIYYQSNGKTMAHSFKVRLQKKDALTNEIVQ